MLNPMHTRQHDMLSRIACTIHVKSGDLAPKGKGTFTMDLMPDGGTSLNMTLPSASGMPEPLDLMSLERVELVQTRSGIYKGKQWILPAIATAASFVAPPLIIMKTAAPTLMAYDWLVYAGLVGLPYAAGVYSGSRLNRMARFIAVTNDGRHCIAEMPEAAFRFVQGVKAAGNLYVAEAASESAANPGMEEAAPA